MLDKEALALIEGYLRVGLVIEIDGRGRLELDDQNQLTFRRNERLSVFLAYAEEDRAAVKRLCRALHKAGFEPWMDKEKLLPGQNWSRAIERAIELSDFFIGCFSSRATDKRGHFQSELAYAMDVAKRVPAERAFLIPVRLNECDLPDYITRKIHYVDLYPDWRTGVKKLTDALRRLQRRREG